MTNNESGESATRCTLLLSFDDTDNLESIGTGHILGSFIEALPYPASYITRHQLFVNPEVPYTSHNSSMCTEILADCDYEELIDRASRYLVQMGAPGSDPGLCVVDMDKVTEIEQLVLWGMRAKKEVLTKAEAYSLAERCNVHLSEHGGDGQGVVGALAGVGLRFSGNDGRVRGKKPVEGTVVSVKELLYQTGFQRVFAYGYGDLSEDEMITIDVPEVKAVYLSHRSTIITTRIDNQWHILDRFFLKNY